MTSRKENQSAEYKKEDRSINEDETVDVFQLPPRKEVHSKPNRKEEKENTNQQNQQISSAQERETQKNSGEKKNSRIYRREKKKEKTARKWNVYLLRFIVILFILTLIAIPLYYSGVFINDEDLDKVNPIGEEIRFQ
ncbi:hypothetical protein [Salirhabdus sp. Marseille-P4669]|uniref:hypothetical protein n=1 Tax=Salirhabdus sp. Marseille-P4669 TaxID=2042310 RepID=UPI000C7AA256|nr:hypothetical protein [Salirhabdus sp. Marseille-P4669]